MKNKKIHINECILKVKPYKTASHKVWQVDAIERAKILKLDWNEATISPSPKVIKRIKNLTDDSGFFNLYPATNNDLLMQKLSEYIELPKEYIQYFASSDALHEYIARVYVEKGTKILIQSPAYDNFRLDVEACGGKVFYSDINEDFSIDDKKFKKDIKKINPNLVYMVTPNNPIGYIHSVEYIASLLKRFPYIMFVVDEAYCEFSGITAKDLVKEYKNIIITRTMSKAFAMANFRFGYMISNPINVEMISKIRNPKNITTFAQEAVIGALSDIDYMKSYVKEVCLARKNFINKMHNWKRYFQIYDSFANFVILKFNDKSVKEALFNYLMSKNIYTRCPSQSPLVQNCIRISIGTDVQMRLVTMAIDEFFNEKENSLEDNKLALFDFCDTLVSFQTADAFVKFVCSHVKNRKIATKEFIRKLLNKIGLTAFLSKKFKIPVNKAIYLWQLKGISETEIDYYASSYYKTKIKPALVPEVMEELQKMKANGYKVYLLSGGYDRYLKYFVSEYGLNGCICTKILFKNGICQGKYDGLDCLNQNKVILLDKYFDRKKYKKIIGYTDSISDLPMLRWCYDGIVVSRGESYQWAKKHNFKELICKKRINM